MINWSFIRFVPFRSIRINGLWAHGIVLVFLLFLSCTREPGDTSQPTLFTLLPVSHTQVDFVNHLDYEEQLKLKFNIYTYRNFYNGGGVGLADVNNDGLIDIFLISNMGPNVLYLNKGDLRFEDISDQAGISGDGEWSTGVALADVNGDGWTDIYVCNSGNVQGDERHNELYINNGDLTFTEQAAAYGINDAGYSTHGAFFDYDRDGDLDLYLLNNSSRAIGSFNLEVNLRTTRDSVGGDKLFRNEGEHFTEVSEQAGIYGSVIGFGLGVTVGDIDQDGWMDIYVSNDFFERDYIYMNNRDGTFRETLVDMMHSTSAASMGADMADINNDHFPEIFVTDMIPEHDDRLKTKTTFDSWDSYASNVKNGYHHQFTRNMLHLNNRDGTFSEIGRFAGVYASDWSWGALIMDLDNDGEKDIFIANGIYKDLTDQDYIHYFSNRDMVMSIVKGKNVDYKTLIDAIPSVKIPSYGLKNNGDLTFRNMTDSWGLQQPSHSNGSAYGDLDNDGDLDLVVNNVNMPAFIYRNETDSRIPGNHHLKVVLVGDPPNTAAIGSKVTGYHKDTLLYLEQMPVRGFMSSVDPRPNLGLGPIAMLDSLVVEWPDGRSTHLTGVPTNQILTLHQKDAVVTEQNQKNTFLPGPAYFKDNSDRGLITFRHRENDFDDFRRDGLLYHMLSTEGPRLCTGDVNGDGLKDLYIGGAKNQSGRLLMQRPDGSFVSSGEEFFSGDSIGEDTDCALFDADGDGDLDLYVASGGNELPLSSSALGDRLYVNDGSGHLSRSRQVLPAGKYESTACVRAEDFDGDGITELFVGMRLRPFLYGVPVNGYILENDGTGKFTDVTSSVAPGLTEIGMIRDMRWADVDLDGDSDMLLAGEWMSPRLFRNEGGHFLEDTLAFGPGSMAGWWNCLETADFNGDGFPDLVAGNHGLNSRFRATPDKPVSMYVNDFDMNGSVEQIICVYEGDTAYPLALKHDLTRQIPELNSKYPKYEMYRNQRIQDIFPQERLKQAIRLEAVHMETSVFLNDGSGRFTCQPLPSPVQFSPVYAAATGDFNGDGNTDILLGGNLYRVKPEVGRYDASYGTFLSGDGSGGFDLVPPAVSGFRLEGEIRDMKEISTTAGTLLVIARNNATIQVLKETGR